MTDDGEEDEQPPDRPEPGDGPREEGGRDGDDDDEGVAVGAADEAAVDAVETDRLCLGPQVGGHQHAGDGREAERVALDAGREAGDEDDVGVPVEDVVEQVAGRPAAVGLAGEFTVHEVEPAVQDDAGGAREIEDPGSGPGRGDERDGRRDRHPEGDDADGVGGQAESPGESNGRIEHAADGRPEPVERHR
jgi:hypothetical protein